VELKASGPARDLLLAWVALAAVALVPSPALSQAQEIRQNALRVFLDCNTFRCNDDYFRTEIAFVNWVRDRTVSDVHLLITSSQTGGGGSLFTLDFIGVGDLEGDDDELQLTTLSTATEDEILRALTGVIAAGLARYSVAIGQPQAFDVVTAQPAGPETDELVGPAQVDDPWNFWVFQLSSEIDLDGEESENERSYDGRFEARRTTDTWKFEFESNASFSRDERELPDSSIAVDDRTNWNTNFLLVYSLADHWSVGVLSGAGASTRRNQDFGANGAAAIEYSFFEYAEAPRRSLTARYDLEVEYFDWEVVTIFGKNEETRPRHQLRLQLFQRQPWGETTVSLDGRQFLDDLSLWSASLNGNLELRITRGLNLDIRGGFELIEDQIFISSEGLSEEDILFGRYERPTSYTYYFSAGLSFEFGSIFNNVVSNRFERRRGRGGGGRGFN
jgi:hypothetical protein